MLKHLAWRVSLVAALTILVVAGLSRLHDQSTRARALPVAPAGAAPDPPRYGGPSLEPTPGAEQPAPAEAVRIAAAGDIACDPGHPSFRGGLGTASACRQQHTSDLLVGMDLAALLVLGDAQYTDGALAKFEASYGPAWGRFYPITRPAAGNHEYGTAGAMGYFQYFGGAAGEPGKGYYSFDVGGWHLIALNSNCWAVGGCGRGSPQELWLRRDLGASSTPCTLAYWHHPRFSSGPHGGSAAYEAFWQALYDAGADIVLSGHDHIYERFTPQGPAGESDPETGIRQFVVGTGGSQLYALPRVAANSEVRINDAFGVLVLELAPRTYRWSFVADTGATPIDTGEGSCH